MNNYTILKSKRKTFGISIKPTAEVIVRVPHKAKLPDINTFIAKYQHWIDKKLVEVQADLHTQQQAKAEGLLSYLGQRYPLQENNQVSAPLEFDGKSFLIKQQFKQELTTIITKWYINQARVIIQPIITQYATQFNLKYSRFSITKATKRWGSCSIKSTICFSYRIAMLPLDVITYIVVHELAHIKHHNHSALFWQQVELMYPNYKASIQWLKANKIMLKSNFD